MRYWRIHNFIYTGECCGQGGTIIEAREEPRDVSDIPDAYVEEISEEEFLTTRNAASKRIEEAKKNPPPPDYGFIEF